MEFGQVLWTVGKGQRNASEIYGRHTAARLHARRMVRLRMRGETLRLCGRMDGVVEEHHHYQSASVC